MPGIIRSRMMTSGGSRFTRGTTSRPLLTTVVVVPVAVVLPTTFAPQRISINAPGTVEPTVNEAS